MASRLPAELVRDIVEYLCTDQTGDGKGTSATLYALCLTSYGFCQLAAPLLYRTVILNNPRQVRTFFDSCLRLSNHTSRPYMKNLWCGIVSEVLYDVPHPLACDGAQQFAEEVAWMQADAEGRYHGFHCSTKDRRASTDEAEDRSHDDQCIECAKEVGPSFRSSLGPSIQSIHVVCPDLGRWAVPLFAQLSSVRDVTISLYPKGNWDLEAAKVERVLRSVLDSCPSLQHLRVVICYIVAAAGSRTVRATRSIPISHAVRSIQDERISLKASDFLFDKYGRSPSEEVIQFTRMQWEARVQGRQGPW